MVFSMFFTHPDQWWWTVNYHDGGLKIALKLRAHHSEHFEIGVV